jgi:DNA-binding GntR family transcriptional regulator
VASAADRVYGRLREAILTGDYAGGTWLREERLAEDLRVSRTPIREALRRLGAEGLVAIDLHRGAQVLSWTQQEVDEILSVRAVLESYAMRLASTKVTEENLAHLEQLMDVMDAKANSRDEQQVLESAELAFEFHSYLLSLAGNGRLTKVLSAIVEFPVLHRAQERYSHARLLQSLAEHRTLVHALRERDADWAEAVMKQHIMAALAEERRLARAAIAEQTDRADDVEPNAPVDALHEG